MTLPHNLPAISCPGPRPMGERRGFRGVNKYKYKARASVGHWHGWGYGNTPSEAAANLVREIPARERRRVLRDVTICQRHDAPDGLHSYPESNALQHVREHFPHGVKLAK